MEINFSSPSRKRFLEQNSNNRKWQINSSNKTWRSHQFDNCQDNNYITRREKLAERYIASKIDLKTGKGRGEKRRNRNCGCRKQEPNKVWMYTTFCKITFQYIYKVCVLYICVMCLFVPITVFPEREHMSFLQI